MNARSIGLFTLALATSGCSYWDLDYLRRCVDGGCGNDAASDIVTEIPPPPCQTSSDASWDVPAPIECNTRGDVVNLDDSALNFQRIGNSAVITGSTVGAPATLHPPDHVYTCPESYDSEGGTSGERVFRYVVDHGPRVMATTDAPACVGSFDTLLYARTSCDDTTGATLDCSDDDQVLAVCDPATGLGANSTVVVGGLAPGQVIYFVVDGYQDKEGAFRLVVTENAASNAPPPIASDSVMSVDRCSCDTDPTKQLAAVEFPSAADSTMIQGGGMDFAAPGDEIVGPHMLPFSHISGVALDGLCLDRNDLIVSDTCRNTVAVIDLVIGDRAVQSFQILPGASTAAPISVGYQSFGGMTVPTDRPVAIALRLRSITPAAGCGSVRFGMTSATLTLEGRP